MNREHTRVPTDYEVINIAGKPKQPIGQANVAGGISAWLGRSNFSRSGGGL